ncbi:MAG TPA: tRNA pseudouridine(55) synthase TruB [Ruminococcaceae bacterium]|nr:tRNA pseudouridine(55) synthase TruB [Oscillospiraceae bacterium]
MYNSTALCSHGGIILTGFIFLDKPEGLTSFVATNRVRRILKINKTGHTGTLDPMATGVLPVMLGGATRFSQYLPTHDKAYRAKILLGTVTDTLDITGTVLQKNPVNVSVDRLNGVINRFVGSISQLPPMYSAVSKDGVRLYKLARQGIEIEREARNVVVRYIKLLDVPDENNEFEIEVSCSAGTYIRSLAADIGSELGCGAVITALRRIEANGVSIDKTVTLETVQQLADEGRIDELITPCDEMLRCYTAVNVSEKQAIRFENGGELDLNRIKGEKNDGFCRVYSPAKKFLGLGKISLADGTLYVEKN